MTFLTGLALRRRSVTVLVILLILVGGIATFRGLERELFPDIEFPNITIVTFYPSANPEAVERDVSEPIEDAISNISGLKELQSRSSENFSLVLATFEVGEDMEEAERTIESNINGVSFPAGVEDPEVSRIHPDVFPVIQLSVLGDRDIPSLQRLVDDLIVPRIEGVEGVFSVEVVGESQEEVVVTVDSQALEDLGLTMQSVTSAVRDNNASLPAGAIDQGGTSFPVRTTHEFRSLQELRDLVVGFEGAGGAPLASAQPGALQGLRPVLLSHVAEVSLGTDEATSISRTNGKPSLNIAVLKEPDANTVAVTSGVLDSLEAIGDLPPDIEIVTLSNDGPQVEAQLDSLFREGLLGFFFAIAVVFAFLINVRPSLLRGVAFTLRPTAIIAIAIPLSILSGVLLMGVAGLALNFMSLAGLAIAVGRVVDDSIVVLENMYRHIQAGEDRATASIDATREVGAAIVASTLTTVVVFIPLAFIQGLVGSFFTPFAMAVSFALLASTLVALTVVPVLGSLLLRQGDFPEEDAGTGEPRERGTWMHRAYNPLLRWSLAHKLPTLAIALAAVLGSMLLALQVTVGNVTVGAGVVPITLFPSGAPEYVTIDIEFPTGTSVGRTFAEVNKVEEVLSRMEEQGTATAYQASVGSSSEQFGPGQMGGGFHRAGFFVRLDQSAPSDIGEHLRRALPSSEDAAITITEISAGPPADDLEITVTGSDFTAISSVARDLEDSLREIDGIINLSNDVSEARDEVVIDVAPMAAGEYGLTAAAVGQQVNQFIVGQTAGEIDLEGKSMDVVIQGRAADVNDINRLSGLTIEGPAGRVKLGAISSIAVEKGPTTISRFDGERSATITGNIVAEDTQAIGQQVEARIATLDVPPGVTVRTGGIFQQIAEGFQDVFTAMAVGIVLVYLVMVATLGSLRNPFIIVLSLPLAIVGALVALAITDRTLSLSALMGFLLLIGVVVTNAIVLLTFVEQLREQGMGVYDSLIRAGQVRLRPILMTAFTTTFALLPLAFSSADDGGIIGAELATVVIGGLVSSTFLTLVVVPVLYILFHENIPALFQRAFGGARRVTLPRPATTGETGDSGD